MTIIFDAHSLELKKKNITFREMVVSFIRYKGPLVPTHFRPIEAVYPDQIFNVL
jgi:hypothetical protein